MASELGVVYLCVILRFWFKSPSILYPEYELEERVREVHTR